MSWDKGEGETRERGRQGRGGDKGEGETRETRENFDIFFSFWLLNSDSWLLTNNE
ncbi:hypothetical protein [Chroococcidiopsis cubana]|uniref:hypothetical protein n=1 Tax=Chroococcidiopsis cubana TaxID=171392 RepID=UPI002ACEB79B|nr:hypothetical protein [Chroococcidiopsis cubana]